MTSKGRNYKADSNKPFGRVFCLTLGLSLFSYQAMAQTPELRSNVPDSPASEAPSSESPTSETLNSDTPINSDTPSQPWEVCNETSFIIRLANAVIREGKLAPKGWDQIIPGQCFGLAAPIGSPRYVYAESSPIHQGGIREWTGQTPICVSPEDFTADATKNCALQNLKTRNYLAVDPTEKRTTLIEPDNFGKKAEIAGIQRLLQDNGYKISRIDGLTGRRTNRYIREFKKKSALPVGIPNTELIEAMASKAKARQSDIGFEICNNTTATVWTAMAMRDNGAWQSRGWWTIEKTECLRPFTKTLEGADAHFFALQENKIETDEGTTFGPDKRLRSVAATPAQFCIAEAKFSALGREYCGESGYAVANFRPLPTDSEGAKINLSDQDFAVPNPVGLR